MKNLSKSLKNTARFLLVALFIIASIFVLSACGDKDDDNKTKSNIYNITFSGNEQGENYNVQGTTWTQSSEAGFDGVYTLTGTVPYNKEFADAYDYTDGRVNFALIRFTSDLKKVPYNAEDNTGFYAKITNFYGQDNQSETILHDQGYSSGENNNTYLLYQGVDLSVRTMIVEISFDGTTDNARIYKFIIDPSNYYLGNDIYELSFDGNQQGELYNVAPTTWEVSYDSEFDAVYTLIGLVPYNIDVAKNLGYTDGRVNFALFRFYSPTLEKVEWDEDTETGFTATITNYYGTDHESTSVRHDTSFTSNEANNTFLFYQGIDSTVRTKTIEISFDGTEENTRIYKFVIDPANYELETAPMVSDIESANIGETAFTNNDSFSIVRVQGNDYVAIGDTATMTAEQADAFWQGVAEEGDKYIVINVKFEANTTIKYGFVSDFNVELGEVVEGETAVKSFEANENTSEDFILAIGLSNSTENQIWRVEITDADNNVTVYHIDMRPLFNAQ